jgi:hypothetical protein
LLKKGEKAVMRRTLVLSRCPHSMMLWYCAFDFLVAVPTLELDREMSMAMEGFFLAGRVFICAWFCPAARLEMRLVSDS